MVEIYPARIRKMIEGVVRDVSSNAKTYVFTNWENLHLKCLKASTPEVIGAINLDSEQEDLAKKIAEISYELGFYASQVNLLKAHAMPPGITLEAMAVINGAYRNARYRMSRIAPHLFEAIPENASSFCRLKGILLNSS